jgi:hypothetical protein
MKVTLVKSPIAGKKWRATFTHEDGKETHTDFGDATMEDYTQHHDGLRRANYLSRHRARENWRDPTSAGSLSRHLLWGDSTSLQQNFRNFKRKFSLT